MRDDELEKKRAKAEWKAQKMRHEADKKLEKARLKIAKKRAEAGLPPEPPEPPEPPASHGDRTAGRPSHARFADAVRGVLYLLLGASLLLALALGQREAVVSLDDVIDSLFVAAAGKIVLAGVGLALAIYGLRKLGVLR